MANSDNVITTRNESPQTRVVTSPFLFSISNQNSRNSLCNDRANPGSICDRILDVIETFTNYSRQIIITGFSKFFYTTPRTIAQLFSDDYRLISLRHGCRDRITNYVIIITGTHNSPLYHASVALQRAVDLLAIV